MFIKYRKENLATFKIENIIMLITALDYQVKIGVRRETRRGRTVEKEGSAV